MQSIIKVFTLLLWINRVFTCILPIYVLKIRSSKNKLNTFQRSSVLSLSGILLWSVYQIFLYLSNSFIANHICAWKILQILSFVKKKSCKLLFSDFFMFFFFFWTYNLLKEDVLRPLFSNGFALFDGSMGSRLIRLFFVFKNANK